jgi:hypothetical protein
VTLGETARAFRTVGQTSQNGREYSGVSTVCRPVVGRFLSFDYPNVLTCKLHNSASP